MFYVSYHLLEGVRKKKVAVAAGSWTVLFISKALVLLGTGLALRLRLIVLPLKINSCTEHQRLTKLFCVCVIGQEKKNTTP